MTDLDELSRLLEQATQERLRPIADDPYYDDEGSIRSHFSVAEYALIAALRNHAEALIRDARACAEIRRVIAAGKDDGSVGRVARRAIAQEQP